MPNTKRGRTAGQVLASLVRLTPLAALLLALVVAVGTVSAADPTVTTNPALVPFSPAPGLPGATQLTFTANGMAGLTACGQDNGVLPTFKLGPVDPVTPSVINFPFIQAGVYTFWVSSDPTCDPTKKLAAGGAPVQATATRVGPTGKVGQDDIQIRGPEVSTSPPGGGGDTELVLHGLYTPPFPTPTTQVFPLPNARVCIMSGDGAQVTVKMQVGQDARPQGLGAAAVTTTVTPVAGQNGCFAIPWVVNGAYVATIARSGVTTSLGFCVGNGENKPSNPPTASGIGKCAQVAFFPDPSSGPFPAGTTIVNGSIVTGADNHAVQVCVAAFSPGAGGTPVLQLANQVNTYNGSGATNLTPLDIGFPSKTVAKVSTYDITGPGPGGAGGAQFVCPAATAVQSGNVITAIIVPDVPGATIIDTKNYFRS